MGRDQATTVIQRPADEVWARIRDFGDLSWYPGVESCTLDGDIRTIRIQALDVEIVERQTNHDAAARTYTFCLIGEVNLEAVYGDPNRILRNLEATITVHPENDSSSVIVWDVEADDDLVRGARDGYQNAIDSLKAELEG